MFTVISAGTYSGDILADSAPNIAFVTLLNMNNSQISRCFVASGITNQALAVALAAISTNTPVDATIGTVVVVFPVIGGTYRLSSIMLVAPGSPLATSNEAAALMSSTHPGMPATPAREVSPTAKKSAVKKPAVKKPAVKKPAARTPRKRAS